MVSGLIVCFLGAVLLRRDLRGLFRRWLWRRAVARVVFQPTAIGPSWRFDFALPDGTPASVVTTDMRLVARREGDGPIALLYDPAAPGRVDLPARPGIGLIVGLALAGLGVVQVLR
ncbi:hypothetical protein AAFN86_08750 [Roseomonas sp. CAU 1739]|uniref:hypothetical protein n=1 Tax=Roseomonas sp. CAU 1739 TaxID=3140364 RepID=UPI00325B3C8F